MSEVQQKLKELPGSATRKINSIYGSIDKFYATVYLIARNEHQCQMMAVPAADQRMKTIRAYRVSYVSCSTNLVSTEKTLWMP